MGSRLPRIDVQCGACGATFQVTQSRLDLGRGRYCSRSCSAKINSRKHGHTTKTSLSPTYTTWAMMLQRCRNPKAARYSTYGATGIEVCDRWSDFDNFLADMGERPEGLTLDRINNELGYSPDNCRWADQATQTANRRNHLFQGNRRDRQSLPEGQEAPQLR